MHDEGYHQDIDLLSLPPDHYSDGHHGHGDSLPDPLELPGEMGATRPPSGSISVDTAFDELLSSERGLSEPSRRGRDASGDRHATNGPLVLDGIDLDGGEPEGDARPIVLLGAPKRASQKPAVPQPGGPTRRQESSGPREGAKDFMQSLERRLHADDSRADDEDPE